LNLDDILFVYGVRINNDLIADISCSQIPVATGNAGGQAQIQNVPWLFYPILTPLSKNPIVKSLDIRTEFISTIDTIGVKDVKKTILLTSSQYNKKFNTPYTLSLQALEREPDPKDFQNSPKTVGVLLEGKFKSDFLNRPLPEGLTEKIESLPESVPTKMIVISDGDVLKNEVSADGTPYPLGYDHYTQQTLRELVEARLAKAAGNRIRARMVWEPSNSNVFVTKPGAFTDLAIAAIEEVTGRRPELSTSGGTSDARFIASYCPVIEFGLVGQTMHQVDERTPVSDLERLTRIYRGVLERYFG